jgi:hypothetical protein
MPKIILGLGAGQCGLKLLSDILSAQPGVRMTCEETPLLPWKQQQGHLVGYETHKITLADRFDRWRAKRREFFIGDVSSSYLPYVEEAIETEPDIRIICLKCSKHVLVSSFCNALNSISNRPVDNWSRHLAPGWYRDPFRMHIYPKYETSSREVALGMYYDEYYTKAEIFAQRFPENFRLIDSDGLTHQEGVREILSFTGIALSDQKPIVGNKPESIAASVSEEFVVSRWKAEMEQHPKSHCVILVPFLGYIHQECDAALKELERRGYTVRRVGGYSAIDQGRNQMATDALAEGFEETLWIDSDISFNPDDVEKLRAHPYPVVIGIYPQKGRRALASHIIPGTPTMTFGQKGSLVEMLYGGTGFMLIRRQAYLTMQERLCLPLCNDRFGQAMIPFFQPLIRRIEDGYWYLAEDYAFCQRARACGFSIVADTTIRLSHIGTYKYSWEDAGMDRPRFGTFTLNFDSDGQHGNQVRQQATLKNLTQTYAWPLEKPDVPLEKEISSEFTTESQDLLEASIPHDAGFVLITGDPLGRIARRIVNIASHATVITCYDWKEVQGSAGNYLDSPDRFYAENWSYQSQIYTIPQPLKESLFSVSESDVEPDRIIIDSDAFHSFEDWNNAFQLLMEIFPKTLVLGNGWKREDIREHLTSFSREHLRELEFRDLTWRLGRPQESL